MNSVPPSITRLAAAFVLLLCAASARVSAQDLTIAANERASITGSTSAAPGLLERAAKLSIEEHTLRASLAELHHSSGVPIVYSDDFLPRDIRVSCLCRSVTVRQALDRLLAATDLRYVEMKSQIVIEPHQAPITPEALMPQPSTARFAALIPPATTRALFRSPPGTQQEAVSGIVVERGSQTPLSGAEVAVEGTTRRTLTNNDGRFRISDLSGTQVTLRVQLLGYSSATQTVQVGASDVRIALEPTALELDQILVTATGEQRRREVGNAVSRVNADSIAQTAPIASVSQLLTGRAAGVNVLSPGGTSTSGSRLRIRGSSSPSLSNEPLVYIDGVRVGSDPISSSIVTNVQAPSRLNDINPDDIESIDILKGPSASTLYGTEGANGVILITTKSGSRTGGVTRWNFWTELGLANDANSYPDSYKAVDSEGNACPLTSFVDGICTQADIRTFNLLENPATTPLGTGESMELGGNVAGSTEGLNYFVSGELEDVRGVYTNDGYQTVNLRANVGAQPTEIIDLKVTAGYISSRIDLFLDGGTALGVLTNGLLGRPDENGWFLWSPEQLNQIDTNQEVERFMGSASLALQPLEWLQVRGVLGLDANNTFDSQLFPIGVFSGARQQGERESNRIQALNYTAEVLGRADFALSDVLSSRTSIGTQYFVDRTHGTYALGQQLVAGSNSLATAAVTQSTETTSESRAVGLFADQQFGYEDRLFVAGGVRADDHSTFGREFDVVIYPNLSVSWVVSEEAFFPSNDLLSLARIRAAWGQSGTQPGVTDAIQFFSALPATVPEGGDEVGATFEGGGLGNPNLKPERSSEIELGIDAGFIRDRINFSLTYYDKTTRDALVFRQVAPSVGATSGRWENLAETRNRGVEGSLEGLILDQDAVDLSFGLSGSYNQNKLVRLGKGVAPITVGNFQRHVEGFPLGGYWARPIESFEDANADGVLAPSEIVIGDTAVFLGEPFPPYEISVRPTITLFDRVRISGLIDRRWGQSLNNFTEGFRCLLGVSRARHDPTTPLEEQAPCLAFAALGANGAFIEDAGFTKLRELSLTFTVPKEWARTFKAEHLSVTFAGRNLATWTNYSGIDPESSRAGASNFVTNDFLQPAPFRRWTGRVNVRF